MGRLAVVLARVRQILFQYFFANYVPTAAKVAPPQPEHKK
jgi:hypothetical protein